MSTAQTKPELGTSQNPSHQIFTLANMLTIGRILLTFVFLFLFIQDAMRLPALVIYALAASTDWLDGQIARKTKTVSWFGKILDPLCDRALLFCGVLGLVLRHELPAWVAFILIGRDIYLGIGAVIVSRFRPRPIDVAYIGKIATAFLMFGFCAMLLGQPIVAGFGLTTCTWLPLLNGSAAPLGLLFVYIGVICSVATAIVYTVKGAQAIMSANSTTQA